MPILPMQLRFDHETFLGLEYHIPNLLGKLSLTHEGRNLLIWYKIEFVNRLAYFR